MNLKKVICLTTSTLALTLAMLSDAGAATIDTKCEVRSGRSKVSVDGRGFGAGLYRASVRSGTTTIFSRAFQRPVTGELEYDFDSNPADIRAGATAIPRTFIKNRTVRGNIYSYNPTKRAYTLRASIVESCRAK
jgi:hypothetical protein